MTPRTLALMPLDEAVDLPLHAARLVDALARFGRVVPRRTPARRRPQPAVVPRARVEERFRRLLGRGRRHPVDTVVPEAGRRGPGRGAARGEAPAWAGPRWLDGGMRRAELLLLHEGGFTNGAAWTLARGLSGHAASSPAHARRLRPAGAHADGPGRRPRALRRRCAGLRAPRRGARAQGTRRADRHRRRQQHGRHPRCGRRLGLGRRRARASLQAQLRGHQPAVGLHAAAGLAGIGPQGRDAAAPGTRRHRHRGPAPALLLRVVEPDDRPHRRSRGGTVVALAAGFGRDSRACCLPCSRAGKSSSTAAR